MAKKKPTLSDMLRVQYGPRAPQYRVPTPQERLQVRVPDTTPPTLREVGKSWMNSIRRAPQGIVPTAKVVGPAMLDMGKGALEMLALAAKDRLTGRTEAPEYFANTQFGRDLRERPGETLLDLVPLVGDAKGIADITREAVMARRAGDDATADELESMLLPVAGAGLIPEAGGAAVLAAKRSVRPRLAVSRTIPRSEVFSVTPEATPGASSGHRADILTGKLSARKRYGEQASPLKRTPEGDLYDVLYAAQGIPQRPAEQAAGAYVNSLGRLENNPVDVVQPYVGPEVSPEMLARIRATENVRGLVTAQEAMAGNMPVATGEPNALLYEMPQQPSFLQMGRSARATGAAGGDTGITATSRGGMLVPFGDGIRPSDVPETAAMLERLKQVYPTANVVPARNVGFFDPALGKWGEAGIEPTAPFSGEATMQTMQMLAEAPEDVATSLAAYPGFRQWVGETIERDVGAPGVREDLQNTRRLIASPDMPKVVELIRKGLSPAAALAALGYSASALAAQPSE